ncbi:hypothetical protein [Streptomyces sp. NPDC051776]|uniref:hypothetical protein n=1 Tax=Streptomyces sp. NPDC051776 TaxID=3155414 RepID=UPI003448CC86
MLSVIALLALLIVWAVANGGSGGDDGKGNGAGGTGPAETITPGPSSSGPAISERPGGRDASEGGGSGSGGSGGAADGGADGEDGSAEGASGGAGGPGKGGDGVPAGASLPDCARNSLELSLRSAENSYAPDEEPKFEIVAKNSSANACKLDFGSKAAVMKITFAEDDDPFWASDDCPAKSERMLLRVPAEGEATQSVEWDRKPSEPKCATPSGGSAKAGTYLVEVKAAGSTARVSFSLKKD